MAGRWLQVGVEFVGKAGPLKRTIDDVKRKFAGIGGGAIQGANQAASAFDRHRKQIGNLMPLWTVAAAGATAYSAAVGLAAKRALDFNRQTADLRKGIDALQNPARMRQFQARLFDMQVPFSSGELANAAGKAGLAGYSENEAAQFARDSAKVATGFGISIDEASDKLLQTRAQLKMTREEALEFLDVVNTFSDKFPGTVDPANLMGVIGRVGALADLAGVGRAQMVGLGAAFLAGGTPEDVAATALKNFINATTKGQNATPLQAKSLAELFGSSATGKAAAKAGRDIATQISLEFQVDPIATVEKIVKQIQSLPANRKNAVVGALFGQESIAAIAPVLNNPELLAKVNEYARPEVYGGSLDKEEAIRMKDATNRLGLLKKSFDDLAISVGLAVLPAIAGIADALTPVINGIRRWVQQNPKLAAIATIAGAITAAFVLALPVVAATAAAIGAIGAPVVAGILGVIAAIAALTAGFTYLYENNERFRKAANDTWYEIKTTAEGVFNDMRNLWEILVGLVTGDFSKISKAWDEMCKQQEERVKRLVDAITTMPWEKSGKDSGNRWANAFINSLKAIIPFAEQLMNGLSMLNGSGAFASPSNLLPGAGALSMEQLAQLAKGAGLNKAEARTMVAVAMAESGGKPGAHNPDASTGDNSYGLWQINMLGKMGPERRAKYGLSSNEDLKDPATNARVMADILRRGGINNWGAFNNGSYEPYLKGAGAAVERVYGARARGGPVMGEKPYMVGENGPELFTPSTSGYITPNQGAIDFNPDQFTPVAATIAPSSASQAVTFNVGDIIINAPTGQAPDIAAELEAVLSDFRFRLESDTRLALND